jgi:serine/threonine protein kinase
VHGDLKAVIIFDFAYKPNLTKYYLKLNILIDDAGNAVLCDFGLARVKADVASRTTETDLTSVAGSRNWMAPERLNGGALRKPCDIYAFGMVVYEVSFHSGSFVSGIANY